MMTKERYARHVLNDAVVLVQLIDLGLLTTGIVLKKLKIKCESSRNFYCLGGR